MRTLVNLVVVSLTCDKVSAAAKNAVFYYNSMVRYRGDNLMGFFTKVRLREAFELSSRSDKWFDEIDKLENAPKINWSNTAHNHNDLEKNLKSILSFFRFEENKRAYLAKEILDFIIDLSDYIDEQIKAEDGQRLVNFSIPLARLQIESYLFFAKEVGVYNGVMAKLSSNRSIIEK